MTTFLIKIFTSAIIIGFVTELARRSPTYGGVIAALPLVSLISLIWIVRQGQSKMELMLFVKSVLYGLPATFLLLLVLYLLLSRGGSLIVSVLCAGACWWVVWMLQQQLMLFWSRQ